MIRRARVFTFAVLLAAGLLATSPTRADIMAHFIQDGTGDVLATMTFATLPTDEDADLGPLSFTPEGDAVLGLGVGPLPSGLTFARSQFPDRQLGVATDGRTVVTQNLPLNFANSNLLYPDTLSSTVHEPLRDDLYLSLRFPTEQFLISHQFVLSAPDGQFIFDIFEVNGAWRIVPEPASAGLLLTPGMLLVRRRRVSYFLCPQCTRV